MDNIKILFLLKESIMHEQMGVMALTAVLKKAGYEVRVIVVDNLGIEKLKNEVKDYGPDIVGYSIVTGEHISMLEVNSMLKAENDFIAVFGGPHSTFFPQLIYESGVDAVCIGEGEAAFSEFCRRVNCKEDFWCTPNFWVKHSGEIFKNPLFPLIEDLDSLPFMDRELMYQADPALYNDTRKLFLAARGCPYKCTYCFNSKYNQIYKDKGSILRHRSPENIVDEICAVRKKYPLKIIWIDDDTFLVKPKQWFNDFAVLYKERVSLPLCINVRANLVTEEIISLLADAGLHSVYMGVECGNEQISNSVLKRELTNKQILNAAAIIKKHNVKLITQNLIGIPVDGSYKVDLETLDLNIAIKPLFAWSSILYPYPGTPIAAYAQDKGFLDNDFSFLETNKRSTLFNFSKKEKRRIENLHKLFGLIVRFPFLRKYADFLCSLPLNSFYVMLFYIWYGYNIKFKLYPMESVRKEIGNYLSLWYRIIKKK